ncbi:MAG TPA: HEPN domain-containing protein [Anaerolineae bacterium]|nr:HEPN domain-containing protein [Anaerolineae bacterium]
MRADTQNWIATAEYDLETARHMLATGRYLYVVFLCHLALEKMLKAHVAAHSARLSRINSPRLSEADRGGASMAEATPQLTDVIQRFCEELRRMGIVCERVLLFGSRAKGAASEGSDIDLFVVSSDWARYNQRERLEMLGVAAARLLEPIQARGVTPEEIATHQLTPLWEQVLQEQAIVIA